MLKYKNKGKKLYEEIGYKKYLEYVLLEGKSKPHQIVALFCLMKEYQFNSYEELGFFFNRYLRAAKRLSPFPMDRIKATINHLIDDRDINFKIGIETIEKYIMEIEMPKDDIILKLSNGEYIKSVKRIQELEKEGKVYYEDNKWYEIK